MTPAGLFKASIVNVCVSRFKPKNVFKSKLQLQIAGTDMET